MKTYGVTESWAKLFTIDNETIGDYFDQLVPLQLVKNGEILLGYEVDVGFHLDVYDIQHRTFINLKTHADRRDSYSATTFVYVESLVMLNSGTYVGPPEIDSEEDFQENDDDVGKETEIEFEDWEEDFEENDDDFSEEEDLY
ncbi:hypothetical protein MKX01_014818 [Papaver californicum]|nr:hypothetical protein MKX01_014818 [Papaver californicum]